MRIDQTSFPGIGGTTLMVPLVLLEEITVSNDATIDLTLDKDYDQFIIDVKGLTVDTNQTNLFMRVSFDGGATFKAGASDYWWANAYFSTSNNPTQSLDTADTEIQLNLPVAAHELGTGANEQLCARYIIFEPGDATHKFKVAGETLLLSDNPLLEALGTSGEYKAEYGRVDVVRLLPHQGNFSTGQVRLWGVLV